MGESEFDNINRTIKTRIKTLKPILEKSIKPILYYKNVQINSIKNGTINFKKGQQFNSLKLSKTLKNCNEIISYIATLGESIEYEVENLLNKKKLANAYILDSMASVATESIISKFHIRMKNSYANQNKQITLGFSPGYCDWSVNDQKELFDIFDTDKLNVELNDSCLMKPEKSISGVFGITKEINHYNPCIKCNKYNCHERRK